MLCYVMCQRRGDCRTRPARQVLFAGRAADSTTEGRIDTTAPFITELFNRSLSSGWVPEMFKAAYVMPRIKKADMDPTDSYRIHTDRSLTCLSHLNYLSGWLRGSC